MATPNDQGAPTEPGTPSDEGEPPKTPPRPVRGLKVLRAVLIVAVFTFAGTMFLEIRSEQGGSWSVSWSELLVVPGFLLGLAVAAADFIWQRGRAR